MRPCECILNVKLTLIFFQGEDSIDYFLGLTPSGIIVLRNRTKVSDASLMTRSSGIRPHTLNTFVPTL